MKTIVLLWLLSQPTAPPHVTPAVTDAYSYAYDDLAANYSGVITGPLAYDVLLSRLSATECARRWPGMNRETVLTLRHRHPELRPPAPRRRAYRNEYRR